MISHGFVVALSLGTAVTEPRPTTEAPLRYVVVVTNNAVYGDDLPELQYADDDGVLYFELLESYARRAEILTNMDDASQRRHPQIAALTRPPTRAELTRTLQTVYRQIQVDKERHQRETVLLFIYVGHGGVDDEGRGFVHLEDALWGRDDVFHEVVSGSPADYTHIIVDACNAYSLLAGRGEETPTMRAARLERFLSGHQLEQYPNVGILIASTPDRETHEWSRIGAGVFSHQVRSALRGAGDVNGDGRLEYSEVAAFVTAANAALPATKRVSVFAWPPPRDRRAAILDIDEGAGHRDIAIASDLRGRMFVENATGERLAEFHAPGYEVRLTVPRNTELFLRNGRHETKIPMSESSMRIATGPSESYTVAHRGAVDSAFSKQLFTVPLTRDYYRGYVVGHDQLVEIEVDVDVQVSGKGVKWVNGATPNGLFASANYAIGALAGVPPILKRNREMGAFVTGLWELGKFVSFSMHVEGGYTKVVGSHKLARIALLPGMRLAWDIGDWLRAHGTIEAGYTALAIRGEASSTDPTALAARARAGVDVRLDDSAHLSTSIAYGTTVVTLNGSETLRPAAQLFVGLAWNR